MARTRRTFQESIDICLKMATRASYGNEVDSVSQIKYWIQRIHGYQKLAVKYNVPVKVPDLSAILEAGN